MHSDDLKQDLVAINEEIHLIQAQADAENRDLTDAEDKEINALFNRFKTAETDLSLSKSQGRQTEPQQPRPQNASKTLPSDPKKVSCHWSPNRFENRRYADVFGAARARDTAGFNDFEEYFAAVHSGMAHPKLIELQAANNIESIGSDGGYLVPPAYTNFLNDKALESEIVRPSARIFNSPSNELNVPQLDVYDHTSDIANLQGGWVEEAESASAETAKFKSQTFRLSKLMLITKSSNELLSDGVGFEVQLTEGMSSRLAYKLDQAFLFGTGVGQPTGLINCASAITVAKASGQAADTIVLENLVEAYSRLSPSCFNTAQWLVSPSAMQQIITMSWSGTQVTNPAWTPSTGISGALPTSIFGIPVRVTEHCKPVGDKGDIILYDTASYAVAQRANFTLARSGHTGFMSDETAWRLTVRVDGQSLWPSVVTPVGGDSTLSNIVTLDARA